ncbi:Brefeldin A-inhibited guanine nucleotide-exchange protein 2 [Frankliniella fusca]|uniref:Brefeldin A-inhibited guanine nucleotide-exchange protein 2 n=1 Tax=Frankliniella fusca TaxID=407009 RepID=A0AAE1HG75_9NEOP|nr:Brefeldin A-inhibited guanine nucleotide-exchange protein 2 [Frankliniella fusca]
MAGSGGVAPRDITGLERTRQQMTQAPCGVLSGGEAKIIWGARSPGKGRSGGGKSERLAAAKSEEEQGATLWASAAAVHYFITTSTPDAHDFEPHVLRSHKKVLDEPDRYNPMIEGLIIAKFIFSQV